MSSLYEDLRQFADRQARFRWLLPLLDESERIIRQGKHGDWPRWQAVLENLPRVDCQFDGRPAAPLLGHKTDDPEGLGALLIKLHPWRKGPLSLAGVTIDTEWRSDWKWNRIEPHLDIDGHRVLDVGCGNGYYGWRMLARGARRVIGIDPTLVYVMQWQACRHFAGQLPNHVLPLGTEVLPSQAGDFDTLFSMGVLYHRRDPVAHLGKLASLLKPGGQLLLETLVLEGKGDHKLVPGERYARMRNVWAVPTIARLCAWLANAGLESIRVLDITATSVSEQRSTPWMKFESLRESLDPDDDSLTIEGHPAPVRAVLLAQRH